MHCNLHMVLELLTVCSFDCWFSRSWNTPLAASAVA